VPVRVPYCGAAGSIATETTFALICILPSLAEPGKENNNPNKLIKRKRRGGGREGGRERTRGEQAERGVKWEERRSGGSKEGGREEEWREEWREEGGREGGGVEGGRKEGGMRKWAGKERGERKRVTHDYPAPPLCGVSRLTSSPHREEGNKGTYIQIEFICRNEFHVRIKRCILQDSVTNKLV